MNTFMKIKSWFNCNDVSYKIIIFKNPEINIIQNWHASIYNFSGFKLVLVQRKNMCSFA